MGIARSTYYRAPKGSADDTALIEAMHAIKDEFEAYGWRRMQAALRHRGWIVNHKKIKRLMREHALHLPLRRRFVATTDSGHDEPICPDRSRDREVDGPNQLWVADLTTIAILGGFVYLAAIMDAWSRRITGYALGRRIDARLTLAALHRQLQREAPTLGPRRPEPQPFRGGIAPQAGQIGRLKLSGPRGSLQTTAGHPAWLRSRLCTYIQTGPASGGRSTASRMSVGNYLQIAIFSA